VGKRKVPVLQHEFEAIFERQRFIKRKNEPNFAVQRDCHKSVTSLTIGLFRYISRENCIKCVSAHLAFQFACSLQKPLPLLNRNNPQPCHSPQPPNNPSFPMDCRNPPTSPTKFPGKTAKCRVVRRSKIDNHQALSNPAAPAFPLPEKARQRHHWATPL